VFFTRSFTLKLFRLRIVMCANAHIFNFLSEIKLFFCRKHEEVINESKKVQQRWRERRLAGLLKRTSSFETRDAGLASPFECMNTN